MVGPPGATDEPSLGAALGAVLVAGWLAADDGLALLPPDEQAPTSSASNVAPRAAVRIFRMGPP